MRPNMTQAQKDSRPVYTRDQIARYFQCIGFAEAEAEKLYDSSKANASPNVHILSRLIKLHESRIPFENLGLHYSQHKSISLHPEDLFYKFVKRRHGRGGYCMEHNIFFGTVLRSLGYDVMSTGGRVSNLAASVTLRDNPGNVSYKDWSHMVNIVTVDSRRYLVDVGFGNNAPTVPVLLKDGWSCRNIGDETGGSSIRVTKGIIPDNTHEDEEQLLWILSVRYKDCSPWLPCYCFSDLEFLPPDLELMSFFVSQNPSSWFKNNLVCSKVICAGSDGQAIGNVTMMGKEVKERRYGKSQVLYRAETEEQRVHALRNFLDIKLTQAEIDGIKDSPLRIW